MFAKGPAPGLTPKLDAELVLPAGCTCKRKTGMGITGYVVSLPDGRAIASAGTAGGAWIKAGQWAERNPQPTKAS